MKRILLSILLVILTAVAASAAPGNDLSRKGDQLFLQGDYAGATQVYARALAEDPSSPVLLNRLEKATVVKNADRVLSQMTRAAQKAGDIRLSVKTLMNKRLSGEKLTLIDIRTPQELALTRVTGALSIQMNEVMQNLDKIPTDGTVVIICHSSPRAQVVTTALRIAGYDNVYSLKGGIMAIANINAGKAPDALK